MVGNSGELEELDDFENFEELDNSEELVLIETCSGCCSSSTLGVSDVAKFFCVDLVFFLELKNPLPSRTLKRHDPS